MTTVLESLNQALHHALEKDERVLLIGEDILDPYGGAFKATRGLSERFPNRVLTTPISEAGFVGLATGMALRGLRPVVEVMFGDFLTLAADQLINHAAKFRWMYHDQVEVPLVIRTPMGGRRGYGPTHSQTLEKHFLGVPGLRVLAPGPVGDPGKLLLQTILETKEPVLFIENKLLYLLRLLEPDHDLEFEIQEFFSPSTPGDDVALVTNPAPAYSLKLRGAPPPVLTLATYGYMVELARQAVVRLAYEHEIFVEIIAPTQLAPFDMSALTRSLEHTRRLLTVEEGTHDMGWGAEVVARCAEKLGAGLQRAGRVAALNLPVPSSGPLEAAVLPGVEQILEMGQKIVQSR